MAWFPWSRVELTEQDQKVLADVDAALARVAAPDRDDGPQALVLRLSNAAPWPREEFARALQARLLAASEGRSRQARVGRRVALVGAVAAALTVGATAAVRTEVPLPSFLDSHGKRVAPQVVTTPPTFEGPSVAITPPPASWTDPVQLGKELGLTIYAPGYLPEGCVPIRNDGHTPPLPHVAHLQYSCVGVSVYALSVRIRPLVPPGAVEELVVGGRPATLVRGGWDIAPTGEGTWFVGPVQLFVEFPDATVRVGTSEGALSREELIRIAESLGPVSAK